jgi:mRNA interferase MazF
MSIPRPTGVQMWAKNGGMTSKEYLPSRGDIIWLQLDPRVGHEQSGRRPVLVLSHELLASKAGLVITCPITSKPKGRSYEVKVNSGKINGAILPIHIRSVGYRAREIAFIMRAPESVLQETVEKVALLINGE